MKRNEIKIVCNPLLDEVSFFFKNEIGEWLLLSGNSPLSRQYYTKASIKDRSKEIVEKIDEIYNRKNRGVDILFQGEPDSYECILRAVETYLPGRDVTCKIEPTKIAVVGKRQVGKTTLIKGMARAQGYKFEIISKSQYVQYVDRHNHVEWIEVNGIDLGTKKVEEALKTVEELVNEGLSKVVYCISGDSGLIEEIEISMITKLKKTFPSIDVITTATMCYKDEVQTQAVIDEIEKAIGHGEVFPTLAQEYRGSAGKGGIDIPFIVEPFGLTELATFIFEGKRPPRNLSAKIKYRNKCGDISEPVGKPIQSNAAIGNPLLVNKDTSSNGTTNSKPMASSQFQNKTKDSEASDHTYGGIKKESSNIVPSKSGQQNIIGVGKGSVGNTALIVDVEGGKSLTRINDATSYRNPVPVKMDASLDQAQKSKSTAKSKPEGKMVLDDNSEQIKIERLKEVPSKPNNRKIVVLGKTSVGKSTLIEGCGKHVNHIFAITYQDGYQIYEDKSDSIQWYEVKGIDLGKEKIEETFSTVVKLAADGMTHLIYCISMEIGKMEKSENDLIARIKRTFPDVKIRIVLTKCYKAESPESSTLLKELELVAGKGNVIQTLAKEYRTGRSTTAEANVISPFGLDLVYGSVRSIIRGDRIFEKH